MKMRQNKGMENEWTFYFNQGSLEKQHLSRNLKSEEVSLADFQRKSISGTKKSSAKSQRQQHAECGLRTARKPEWLEYRKVRDRNPRSMWSITDHGKDSGF